MKPPFDKVVGQGGTQVRWQLLGVCRLRERTNADVGAQLRTPTTLDFRQRDRLPRVFTASLREAQTAVLADDIDQPSVEGNVSDGFR